MKILYNWLKELVEVTASPDEARQRLSAAGIVVDTVEESPAGPRFDVDLTTNRPDCMGHYGIAREVAAIYRVPLKAVRPKLKEAAATAESATRVDIECPDLCGRFTARVLRGVKVQPSPDWLRQRLEALGINAINNVVDATNYVMIELGHPLHAFDFDTLAERRIVVRRARVGEKLRTLDGIERTLTPEMCMVCDAAKPTGVGGVMGGGETEIGFATQNVLLECAWFDPLSVRRTARALGLRTEASTRFERGMDPELAEPASRRCAELIQELAGGEILKGVVDAYPRQPERQKIELTRREILRVMGADIPDADIEAVLKTLGFDPVRTDAGRGSKNSLMAAWECRRPTWRHDITREIDLIEEVARHYGFDKFPARLPPARQPAARLPNAAAEDALRERLVALGYQEIISIPLVDPADEELFRADAAPRPVRVGNPLASDASQMRTSGLVSMLHALEWNINRGQHNTRLFEMGKAYALEGKAPRETRILTLGATGAAREKSAHDAERAYSFADLKGDLELLAELAGGIAWSRNGEGAVPSWLAAAQAGVMEVVSGGAGKRAGVAGRLARAVQERFKLRQEVFVAEVQLDALFAGYSTSRAAIRYRPIPRFPAVERDFSLLLPEGTVFADVAGAIGGLGITEITSIEAVDLFRGSGQVPKGKYSLLVRVTLQSAEATFTEAQLSDFSARIIAALEKTGATIRM
ncbi:MAG: phenylalanine--tRNA ligase subunit beta [Candidatus Acidiferrales bacterium]